MRFAPLGDAALLVILGEGIDRETSAQVHRALAAIEAARIAGVTELAPGYRDLAVHYNPERMAQAAGDAADAHAWLCERVRHAIEAAGGAVVHGGRVVRIPVCYGGECGPDLGEVARYTGFSEEEVIRRHSAGEYLVHLIGFAPGFPYLGGLPTELATPRRSVPRTQVPASSVGIGGAQTGIYPHASPGGWQIIGRTPAKLFDPAQRPPALLQAGDRVRFEPISQEEFDSWQK